MKLLRRSRSKKSAKAGQNDAAANEKDISFETNAAIYEVPPPSPTKQESKAKRKKFGLFSKSKSKGDKSSSAPSTPQRNTSNDDHHETSTPATVKETDHHDDNHDDHVVSVIPVGQASDRAVSVIPASPSRRTTPSAVPKTEDELRQTLSWARSLLVELDTAEAADGSGEGTELILPSPHYEGVEAEDEPQPAFQNDATEEDDDDNREPSAEDDGDGTPEGNHPPKSTAGGDELNTSAENEIEIENDAVLEPKKSKDETDPQNFSMVVEEEDRAEDDPPPTQTTTFARTTVIKIMTAAFRCTAEDAENCAALPDTIGGVLPTSCQPIQNAIVGGHTTDLETVFDERSGSEFLHGMQNVGYTLIYHELVGEDSWEGRTVNLIFRPGMCSAATIVQPAIEWNTMVGGKSNSTTTKSMKLLTIDAISTSKARGGIDGSTTKPASLPLPTTHHKTNNDGDACFGDDVIGIDLCGPMLGLGGSSKDEFDCFFTITSQKGEINLFEALNSEDCLRIVAGIRYNAQRLSHLLIGGDAKPLLSDFYDNSGEPEESRLSPNEVMTRLTHSFLDGL